MNPDLFYVPRIKDAAVDPYFVAAGRALALATRFEASCRTIHTLLALKTSGAAVLSSEAALRRLSAEIQRRTLSAHIAAVGKIVRAAGDPFSVLNKARVARNEVAHSLTLGFEYWSLVPESARALEQSLRSTVPALAEGECLAAFIGAVLTDEELPPISFLAALPKRYVQWVLASFDAGA